MVGGVRGDGFGGRGQWWSAGVLPFAGVTTLLFSSPDWAFGPSSSTSFLTDGYSCAVPFPSQNSTCFILLCEEGWQNSARKAPDKNSGEQFSCWPLVW